MDSRSDSQSRRDTDPGSATTSIGGKEREWGDVDEVLSGFRRSVQVATERPGSFWENQRAAVAARLQQSTPAPWQRTALLWAPAVAAVVLCLFLFVKDGKAPTPDFAGGADQDLLEDIERATDQEYPSAMEPAALITREMEQNVKTQGP